ncbi:MAG: phosphoribosylformylglycinamidine cyclo-ligase [Candidatus Dadabacteria bacterium]|nr:MAG: phosphoribosylformylglycinamidine cyclo-ligase [Candidatus Dadabacteria bacterium]
MSASKRELDYRSAGVDIRAADRLVNRFARLAAAARGPGVLSGIGPFAAVLRLPPGYRDPVLLASTDGVGTKLLVARQAGRHDTIGIDLVAMCVNDVLACGGRPLWFLDYLATASLAAIDAESIVRGIARGCQQAGVALVGGETAEMPGMYRPGEYDLAGFAIGVAERRTVARPERVRPGQVLVGLPASGLHSNGYSLARAALGIGRRRVPAVLLDELLEPTRIYVKPVLAALARYPVRAMAHITGGGLPANLARILPAGCSATIDRAALPKLPLLERIQRDGNISQREMDRTFNSGIGFVLVTERRSADELCRFFARRRLKARVIGSIGAGRRRVVMRGK